MNTYTYGLKINTKKRLTHAEYFIKKNRFDLDFQEIKLNFNQ